jgi:hypothetical protein
MIHDPEASVSQATTLWHGLVRQPPFPYRGWQLFRFDPGRGVNTTEGWLQNEQQEIADELAQRCKTFGDAGWLP